MENYDVNIIYLVISLVIMIWGIYLMLNSKIIKEINIYHTFKPSIKMWSLNINEKSYSHFLENETYYGGTCFKTGYFIFISTRIGKRPGLCIKIEWWKTDVFKNLKKK